MKLGKLRALNYGRTSTMALVLISFFVLVSILTRLLRDNAGGAIAALIAGLIVIPIIASPIEWLVHRYVYHRSLGLLRRITQYTLHTITCIFRRGVM
jgi:hypothetical protein